jgi:hypothetical protein
MMHRQVESEGSTSAPAVVTARLDELARHAPGADAVAYLDTAAGTVLGTSSEPGQSQETLDAVCALAARVIGAQDDGTTLVATRLETVVLAPATPGRGDALAFFFDPECPPEAARDAAGVALAHWPE